MRAHTSRSADWQSADRKRLRAWQPKNCQRQTSSAANCARRPEITAKLQNLLVHVAKGPKFRSLYNGHRTWASQSLALFAKPHFSLNRIFRQTAFRQTAISLYDRLFTRTSAISFVNPLIEPLITTAIAPWLRLTAYENRSHHVAPLFRESQSLH